MKCFFSNKNIHSNDAIKIKHINITINNEERPAVDDDFAADDDFVK